MAKLQIIYNNWNEAQKKYYKDILEALLLNEVQTDKLLLQKDVKLLSKTINIQKQRLRAFIRQVELDSFKKANDRESQKTKSISTKFKAKYLSTGFESLDELLSGGFQFHQIVEICGESDADEMNFISQILSTFIGAFSKDNIFIFDTSGILEPRRLNATSRSDLTNIECFQAFNFKNLLQSMENVAALLASVSHEHPPLIVIDDPAKLIGFDWSVPEVLQLVKFIQVLSRDINACVIILQQNIATTKKVNEQWNSMVDLRLHLSGSVGDTSNIIQILKTRHKTDMQSCTVNLFQ